MEEEMEIMDSELMDWDCMIRGVWVTYA